MILAKLDIPKIRNILAKTHKFGETQFKEIFQEVPSDLISKELELGQFLEYIFKSNAVELSNLKKCIVDMIQNSNNSKLREFEKVIDLVEEKIETDVFEGHERELVNIIEDYAHSWETFYRYDKGFLDPENLHTDQLYMIRYSDVKMLVMQMKKSLQEKGIASTLFGLESGEKLKGVVESINQSFGGQEIYPSIEQKAAHLLYLVIKDHPLIDGNKRVGAMLFLYYLHRNNFQWKVNKERKINDNALVALALLVAMSEPVEKEIMIKLIIRLIQNDYVGVQMRS